jgi:hypothetical protein
MLRGELSSNCNEVPMILKKKSLNLASKSMCCLDLGILEHVDENVNFMFKLKLRRTKRSR